MTTTQIGRDAENSAAEYLRKDGYKVLDQNWRTRWCEVDIVASKNNTIYFVEVKYRKLAIWGDGLDAITPKKLQQMSFAAELWIQQKIWLGDYALAVISISGEPPIIDTYIVL